MNCPKCGKRMKNGTRFCPYCGAERGPEEEGRIEQGSLGWRRYLLLAFTVVGFLCAIVNAIFGIILFYLSVVAAVLFILTIVLSVVWSRKYGKDLLLKICRRVSIAGLIFVALYFLAMAFLLMLPELFPIDESKYI